LPGPEPNLRKNAFVAPHKFAKESAVPLRVDLSRENFDAWNPSFLNFALASIRSSERARVYASLRKLVRERCCVVISGVYTSSCAGINALPKISFLLVHFINSAVLFA
jgi:hypothetical protein